MPGGPSSAEMKPGLIGRDAARLTATAVNGTPALQLARDTGIRNHELNMRNAKLTLPRKKIQKYQYREIGRWGDQSVQRCTASCWPTAIGA